MRKTSVVNKLYNTGNMLCYFISNFFSFNNLYLDISFQKKPKKQAFETLRSIFFTAYILNSARMGFSAVQNEYKSIITQQSKKNGISWAY